MKLLHFRWFTALASFVYQFSLIIYKGDAEATIVIHWKMVFLQHLLYYFKKIMIHPELICFSDYSDLKYLKTVRLDWICNCIQRCHEKDTEASTKSSSPTNQSAIVFSSCHIVIIDRDHFRHRTHQISLIHPHPEQFYNMDRVLCRDQSWLQSCKQYAFYHFLQRTGLFWCHHTTSDMLADMVPFRFELHWKKSVSKYVFLIHGLRSMLLSGEFGL